LTAGRAIVVSLALVLVLAPVAHGGVADRVGNTFGFMVDDFVKVFQPVEGVVVQLEGDAVYVDLGAAQAYVGQELTIFRKGDRFVHPLTGKPLGHYEKTLGYAQIRQVSSRFSDARFVPIEGQPHPGPDDGVRITRGRIKVAITPVLDLSDSKADLRRVPYLLGVPLERSKRFLVVDPLAVTEKLESLSMHLEEVLARPERAVQAARSLEVNGWLVPMLIERRGVTYLDVTWISAVTGTALLSRREPLVPASAIEEQRFPWEPKAED
jgi:hypothetical protein